MANPKRRRTHGGFSMLVHAHFTSAEYALLSPRAVKALVDVYCQFKGSNNGDLVASWSVMAKVGWTSKDQLGKAIDELLERGWLAVTRQGGFHGGKHLPRLLAVTWLGVDHCGGKLDCKSNPVPSMAWKRPAPPATLLPRLTGQSDPPHGSVEAQKNADCPALRVGEA